MLILARNAVCFLKGLRVPGIQLPESNLVAVVRGARKFLSEGISVIPHVHKYSVANKGLDDWSEINISRNQNSLAHTAVETVFHHIDRQRDIDFLLLALLSRTHRAWADVKTAE